MYNEGLMTSCQDISFGYSSGVPDNFDKREYLGLKFSYKFSGFRREYVPKILKFSAVARFCVPDKTKIIDFVIIFAINTRLIIWNEYSINTLYNHSTL